MIDGKAALTSHYGDEGVENPDRDANSSRDFTPGYS
jgi:hypothetical protein